MLSPNGIRVARELVRDLEKAAQMAWDLDMSLDALEADLSAERDGWAFSLVVDYSELHRYLHPYADRDRDDREKFYIGQLVLNYLFNVSDEKMLLLPVYAEEFLNRLETITSDMEALLKATYLTTRHKKLSKFVSNLKKATALSGINVDLFRKYALDILVEDNTRISLTTAVERYIELVKEGKIYFLEHIEGPCRSIEIDRNSKEFAEIFRQMVKRRREYEKYIPNSHDAEGALWVKKANNLTFKDRQAYVLVSSSPRIKPVFRSVELKLTRDDKPFVHTILRDLYYFLFRFYFCRTNPPTEKTLSNIDQTRRLFKEYIRKMEIVRGQAVEMSLSAVDKTSILPLYKKLTERIWEFERFMAKATQFRPSRSFYDRDTILKIRELAQDEQAFRAAVSYALNELKTSLKSIGEVSEKIMKAYKQIAEA
ncbi:MAG: hypothetical protein JSV85_03875 [Candidatus Bathyarchaeota archaeon]|nr:MAG: hypothetical protein JSV85_03875 [Candidatus Bathyarchaeota archaeon]